MKISTKISNYFSDISDEDIFLFNILFRKVRRKTGRIINAESKKIMEKYNEKNRLHD